MSLGFLAGGVGEVFALTRSRRGPLRTYASRGWRALLLEGAKRENVCLKIRVVDSK